MQFRLALDVQEEVLGPDHPDTLRSLVGMWTAFCSQGAAKEACDALTGLLPRLVRVLGPADEQTLGARLTLVWAHNTLGNREAALTELSEIAAYVGEAENPRIAAAVDDWRRELG